MTSTPPAIPLAFTGNVTSPATHVMWWCVLKPGTQLVRFSFYRVNR